MPQMVVYGEQSRQILVTILSLPAWVIRLILWWRWMPPQEQRNGHIQYPILTVTMTPALPSVCQTGWFTSTARSAASTLFKSPTAHWHGKEPPELLISEMSRHWQLPMELRMSARSIRTCTPLMLLREEYSGKRPQ